MALRGRCTQNWFLLLRTKVSMLFQDDTVQCMALEVVEEGTYQTLLLWTQTSSVTWCVFVCSKIFSVLVIGQGEPRPFLHIYSQEKHCEGVLVNA
jgi:hypothetical protein